MFNGTFGINIFITDGLNTVLFIFGKLKWSVEPNSFSGFLFGSVE